MYLYNLGYVCPWQTNGMKLEAHTSYCKLISLFGILRKEEAKHKYRRRKGMISSRSKNTNRPLSHTAVPSSYVQKILSRTGPFYSLTGQHVGWKRLAHENHRCTCNCKPFLLLFIHSFRILFTRLFCPMGFFPTLLHLQSVSLCVELAQTQLC